MEEIQLEQTVSRVQSVFPQLSTALNESQDAVDLLLPPTHLLLLLGCSAIS